MAIDHSFLPGDMVEIIFPRSDDESVGTVKSKVFEGRVKVEFPSGNVVELPVGDLTRLNK